MAVFLPFCPTICRQVFGNHFRVFHPSFLFAIFPVQGLRHISGNILTIEQSAHLRPKVMNIVDNAELVVLIVARLSRPPLFKAAGK